MFYWSRSASRGAWKRLSWGASTIYLSHALSAFLGLPVVGSVLTLSVVLLGA